jgi:hypothetical protein
LIATCFATYIHCCMHACYRKLYLIRTVEIVTNPQQYCIHAGAALKRYTLDMNQATLTQYHISDYNFDLDISRLNDLVFGNIFRHRRSVFEPIHTVASLHHRFTRQRTTTTMPT